MEATQEKLPTIHEMTFGDVTITRAVELVGSVGMTPRQFFPDSTTEVWEENEDWLTPDFLIPSGATTMEHTCRVAMQTWVLRSGGRTILLDTGIGNHKERPYIPSWSHLDTGYLANLAAVGVAPDDVDIVVNTHLHVDHVGWNTRLDGRTWVPTFKNAEYFMPSEELEFWNPANGHKTVMGPGAQNAFEDSVAPVLAEGLVRPWTRAHRIDENLVLETAPGHTPGSSILRVSSRGEEVLLIGDTLHTPAQIVAPNFSSCFCEDVVQASSTRRKLFAEAADKNILMLAAHFGGHGGFSVQRVGSEFALAEWAPFERI
jgi:glyoxylase-like metal-dependent hydrolase (beta-lactamase superfamily II)